jgi:hypothetical protein
MPTADPSPSAKPHSSPTAHPAMLGPFRFLLLEHSLTTVAAVVEGNQREEVEVHLPRVEEAAEHHPVVVVVGLHHTDAYMSRVLAVLLRVVRHSLNHSQILGSLHIHMPVVLLEELEEEPAAREPDRRRRRRHQVPRHSHRHSCHGPCPRLPMDEPTKPLGLESRSHHDDRFSHAATEQLHR